MRQLILGLIACVLSLGVLASCATTMPVWSAHPDEQAWYDACRISQYDCRGVDLPSVVVADLTKQGYQTALGVYDERRNPKVVWMTDTLEFGAPLYRAVLTHEYVHYLQRFARNAPDVLPRSCDREKEAWEVSNALAREMGRPDLDNKNWAKPYFVCDLMGY